MKDAQDKLERRPASRTTPYLRALLGHTAVYEKSLIRLVDEAYQRTEDPHRLLETVTELSDAGELYCLRRRSTLDAMCSAIQKGDLIHPVPFPSQVDISQDLQIRYDQEAELLQIEMPGLLPLKGKWSTYLPNKIRYALGNFCEAYRREHGEPLRLAPAFVLFIHHYSQPDVAGGSYRDYDNMEFSSVLNALHSTQLFNDSAATCVTMQMAVPGSRSCTVVYITKVGRMLPLLEKLDFSLYCQGPGKRSEKEGGE